MQPFGRALSILIVSLPACAGKPTTSSTSSNVSDETCVTIQRGTSGGVDDSFVKANAMRRNYGERPHLRVSAKEESLLHFDLSAIPANAVVVSSTLMLYVHGESSDGSVDVHRVTAPWSETAVTYQSFSQHYASAVAAQLHAHSHAAVKSIDLTALTTDWLSGAQPNYGVALMAGHEHHSHHGYDDDDDDAMLLASSESWHAAHRPALVVCYTQPTIDACALSPCQNGATCTNTGTGYTCGCPAGFTGTNCEVNIDDCTGNPCQNGGTCSDEIDGYSCSCPAGYDGASCETNIDDCASVPCQNGGVCTDGVASFTCQCAPGYDGASCDHLIDNCAGDPCHNGASCTNGVGTYTCTCAPGYTDPNCDTNIDDCVGNACQNGTCVDGIGDYTCACEPEWGGTYCEVNLDECALQPCLHGGACTNGFGMYTCSCPPGYDGANCEIDINDCAGDPCQNGGLCVDGVASFTCTCATGFTGDTCEINIDDCASNPCQNGGSCTDGVASYTCSCPPGYVGAQCETFSCTTAVDGTPCDDLSACTQNDTCQGGLCNGTGVTCPLPDQCHVGVCDPVTGCGEVAKPDGTTCNDGDPTNNNDVCIAGFCGGTKLVLTIDPEPGLVCAGVPQPVTVTAAIQNAAMTAAGVPWTGSVQFTTSTINQTKPVDATGRAQLVTSSIGNFQQVNGSYRQTGLVGIPVQVLSAPLTHRTIVGCP